MEQYSEIQRQLAVIETKITHIELLLEQRHADHDQIQSNKHSLTRIYWFLSVVLGAIGGLYAIVLK